MDARPEKALCAGQVEVVGHRHDGGVEILAGTKGKDVPGELPLDHLRSHREARAQPRVQAARGLRHLGGSGRVPEDHHDLAVRLVTQVFGQGRQDRTGSDAPAEDIHSGAQDRHLHGASFRRNLATRRSSSVSMSITSDASMRNGRIRPPVIDRLSTMVRLLVTSITQL